MSGILQTFLMYGAKLAEIVTTNLILHWDAGNAASYPGTGTSIQDLTASNYDGTLNGAVYNSGDGGKFVFVEAENDWIDSIGTTAGSAIVGTSDFTIEVWVQLSNVNQQGWLFGNRNNSTGPQFSLIAGSPVDGGTITASKKLGISMISTNTSTAKVFSTVNDIVDGAWKHIVVTRVGLSFKMYVNGVEQTLNIVQNLGSSDDISGTSTWRSGDHGSGTGLFSFDGSTSIYRLYNKALSSVEVTQNLNAEKSRYGL